MSTTTYDLVRLLSELNESLMGDLDLSEPMTIEERARIMFATEQVIGTLTAFKSEVNASITADMDEEVLIVQGLPPLRRSEGNKRKDWRGALAASDVTKATIGKLMEAHAETGESPALLDAVEAVRDALVRCGGLDNKSHAWRSGELAKLELSANDYAEWERGTPSVRFDR